MAEMKEDLADHLQQNRSLVLNRSLLVGLAGLVPVPALEEMLATSLRRGLLRRLAAGRQVDIEEAALDVLAGASPTQQQLGLFAMTGALLSSLRPGKAARRMMIGLLLLRQVDETLRTFHLATLFDHYCAKHHVGAALTETQAYQLRAQILEATKTAERGAAGAVFERALSAAWRVLRAAPEVLLRLVHRQQAEPPALAAAEAAVKPESRALMASALIGRYSRRLV